MRTTSLLAAGLAAAVPAACAVIGRRDDVITCDFSSSASDGDTCTSFAADFNISADQFTSLNPGLDCTAELDSDTDYCIIGSIAGTSTTTTYAITTYETYTAPTTVNTITSFDATFTTSTWTTTAYTYTPYAVNSDIATNCDIFHKIVKGDTCDSIAAANGISRDELYDWNNDVGTECYALYVSNYLCVHTPGASTSAVSTTTAATASVPASVNATTTGTATGTATITGTATSATSAAPSPTQPGTVSSCTAFHKVVSGDTCATIESDAGISAAQFAAWNTGINSDCSNIYLDYYVCIAGPAVTGATSTSASATATSTTSGSAIPSPTQPGTVSSCTGFHKVVSGDSCGAIESAAGISAAQFAAWNTGIDSDCSNIYLDYYVCIAGPAVTTTATPTSTTTAAAMPSPTQPGTISTCTKFHEVVSGDYCYQIETDAGISSDDFFKWNSGINSDCSNIYLGYYVCIGV